MDRVDEEGKGNKRQREEDEDLRNLKSKTADISVSVPTIKVTNKLRNVSAAAAKAEKDRLAAERLAAERLAAASKTKGSPGAMVSSSSSSSLASAMGPGGLVSAKERGSVLC